MTSIEKYELGPQLFCQWRVFYLMRTNYQHGFIKGFVRIKKPKKKSSHGNVNRPALLVDWTKFAQSPETA